MKRITLLAPIIVFSACADNPPPGPTPPAVTTTPGVVTTSAPTPIPPVPQPKYDALTREAFNQAALQQNLPLYWVSDKNGNNAVDPDEVVTLLFYPTEQVWTSGGRF